MQRIYFREFKPDNLFSKNFKLSYNAHQQMTLLFCTHSVSPERYYFCIAVYVLKMVYSLKLRIFITLEFHTLDQSFAVTRCSFQRKFNIKNSLPNCTIQALLENSQGIENNNDVGRPKTIFAVANAAILQQIIQQ